MVELATARDSNQSLAGLIAICSVVRSKWLRGQDLNL